MEFYFGNLCRQIEDSVQRIKNLWIWKLVSESQGDVPSYTLLLDHPIVMALSLHCRSDDQIPLVHDVEKDPIEIVLQKHSAANLQKSGHASGRVIGFSYHRIRANSFKLTSSISNQSPLRNRTKTRRRIITCQKMNPSTISVYIHSQSL